MPIVATRASATQPTSPTSLRFPGGNTGLIRYFIKHLIPDALPGDTSLANIVMESQLDWSALDHPDSRVRMRLSSTVAAVQHDGSPENADSVSVTYFKDGELQRVEAGHVAVCSGQWVNRHIVKDLPERPLRGDGPRFTTHRYSLSTWPSGTGSSWKKPELPRRAGSMASAGS